MLILAYIGPGGGVAIAVSLVTLLLGVFAAVCAYLAWPFMFVFALIRGRRLRWRYPYRRVVVLGLDGLDPKLLRRFMAKGLLPNFSKLAGQGHFSDLETTLPAMTPAAWPSFMTGNDPSHHGIYDFLSPDRRSYLPKLSSYETAQPRSRRRFTPPRARSLRRGIAFWETLARHGAECTILRVPITFPPPKFRGRLLAGLCVPDLLGTQGTFTCFTTSRGATESASGEMRLLVFKNGVAHGRIEGPRHPANDRRLTAALTARKVPGFDGLAIEAGGQRLQLRVGASTPWIAVRFPFGLLSIQGQVQFHLVSTQPELVLYMSPVQIAPERPAMAVSHPRLFANYLAKLHGPFGTLGFLEDTTALNDGGMTEVAFLRQALDAFSERKRMFFHALDLKADDLTICVFDTPDRIQHMFWRDLERDHPASGQASRDGRRRDTIERLYVELDALLGQTLSRIDPKTVLIVASDHGFTSFRRQVDLNAWLHQQGYLHLQQHADPGTPWLEAVDWSRTRAYALGLAGIFLNVHGREGKGIVKPGGEYEALVDDLKTELEGLRDTECRDSVGRAGRVIRRAFVATDEFSGPFRADAPDLLVGYEPGYRVAWNCAKGMVGKEVITDNTRPWSGDHCVDPAVVPGVLMTNVPLPNANARLVDLPATILDVFGVAPDAPMQGRSLLRESAPSRANREPAATDPVEPRALTQMR